MNAEERDRRRDKRNEMQAEWDRWKKAKVMMAISPNLGSLKVHAPREQDVLFLRHLAPLFGKRTFDPHKVPEEICGFVFTKGLAYSSAELQEAHFYLLTYLWPRIVGAGLVTEAPPGSGMYEITVEGWAVVEDPEDYYLPF
jgi:hypothetical protein